MAENIEAERVAFEAWFNGTMYREDARDAMEIAWQAARRTPSASIGEDGLPELPAPEYAQMNVLSHGMVSVQCGYTANQMRQYALDAIADDRRARRPRVKLDPELMAALDEAAKTRSTGTLLPDGSAVFINYGHDYGDNAHLECTACGGSGHIDDQLLIAGQSGEESPQAAQGVAVGDGADPLYERAAQIVTASQRASISLVQRTLMIGYNRAARLLEAMEKAGVVSAEDQNGRRTVLSSEQQAGKGESACGS